MTVLACDFGGRRIKLGIVRDGVVLTHRVIPAHADQSLEVRLPGVAAELRSLCQAISIEPSSCHGIGIAYPSIIDCEQARIVDGFGKFGDATKFDARAWALDEFGLPLAIDNDARMALIGEWQWGAASGYTDAAMMTLGTGLGGAAIVGDRPLRGRHGQAAILSGHLTVQLNGRSCVCGNVGCAEAEASTSVLAKVAHSQSDFAGSELAQLGEFSYEDVFRCAQHGDPVATAIRDQSLQVWGAMAVNMIHAFDPEILVLGGGIMGSAEFILPAITDAVRRYAHTPWGHVNVVASQLGDHAALVAAEWLVREHLMDHVGGGDFQL